MQLTRLLFVSLLCWISVSKPVNESTKQIAELTTDFACRLYKELFLNDNKNMLVAPFNAASSLILALISTTGDTAMQLKNILRLTSLSDSDIQQSFLNVVNITSETNNSITLHLINQLYVNKETLISDSLKESGNAYYMNNVKEIDLNDTNQAALEINERISAQTQSKITNIVSKLQPSTSIIMVSAMYFKGEWALPFSESSTKVESFYTGSGPITTVNMMFQSGIFKYGESETLRCKAIELPYAESEFSMFVLLPNAVNGLKELEAQLTADNLNALVGRMILTKLEILKLPKFKLENQLNMTEVLNKLGVQNLFINLDKSSSFSEKLRLSDMFLKSAIEVSETISGFSGAVEMAYNNSTVLDNLQNRSKDFIANHPFVFFVRDNRTGILLCLGRILHPSLD